MASATFVFRDYDFCRNLDQVASELEKWLMRYVIV